MKAVQMLMMGKSGIGAGNGYIYHPNSAAHANFAPTDWKVPTAAELQVIATNVTDSGDLKEAGYTHWNSPNSGADNSSGFTAYGSGYRLSDGTFGGILTKSYMLPNTADNGMLLEYDNTTIWYNQTFDAGSIRLLYTGAGTPTSVTDYDGNIYDVVQIGSQYWTVQNWKCTKLNDGTPLTKVTSDATWAAATSSDYYYCAYDNNPDLV